MAGFTLQNFKWGSKPDWVDETMKQYRKNMRLKDYNYQINGAYYITICTDFKQPLIGPKEKTIIEKELKDLEQRFKGIALDYFQIMKTHVHIIFILNNCSTDIPHIVGVFKSLTSLKLKRNGYAGKYFWQKNYYEHVVRNEKALLKVREYIQNNPLAEELSLKIIYNEAKSGKPDHYRELQ